MKTQRQLFYDNRQLCFQFGILVGANGSWESTTVVRYCFQWFVPRMQVKKAPIYKTNIPTLAPRTGADYTLSFGSTFIVAVITTMRLAAGGLWGRCLVASEIVQVLLRQGCTNMNAVYLRGCLYRASADISTIIA